MTLETLLQDYTDQGGSLSDEALAQAGNTAWSYLMQQTMGRVSDCGEACEKAVFDCFRELVDTIHSFSEQGCLTRETVGDWTRSYDCSGVSLEKSCHAIIRRWLGETGLLFRGWPE